MESAAGKTSLLVFIHDLAPFGAQRVALNTVRFLDKDKFSVTVCSFWGDETLAGEFAACGARVEFLRAVRFLDPAAWLRLLRLLLELRPQIVQTNMPELSVPVRLLSVFLPGVRVLHAVENPLSSEPWYWRWLNRATFFLCARVVFCSESMAASGGYAKGRRLRVVQNGIELRPVRREERGALRGSLGVKDGEKAVCCVARLSRQKGQDVLLKAAALLAGRGLPVRVLLAGDGEDLPALRGLADALRIGDRISFLGRRPDIPEILSACDVYAAPSRWEGLGLSLGEAMLAGLPCVGTEIPGHADILKDGVTGLSVPVEDPGALADGIAKVLEGRAPAGMAERAAALVRSGFSVEAMSAKYAELYLETAGGN